MGYAFQKNPYKCGVAIDTPFSRFCYFFLSLSNLGKFGRTAKTTAERHARARPHVLC